MRSASCVCLVEQVRWRWCLPCLRTWGPSWPRRTPRWRRSQRWGHQAVSWRSTPTSSPHLWTKSPVECSWPSRWCSHSDTYRYTHTHTPSSKRPRGTQGEGKKTASPKTELSHWALDAHTGFCFRVSGKPLSCYIRRHREDNLRQTPVVCFIWKSFLII